MKIINNECRHILVSMLKYIRPYKYKIIMLYLVSIISMIIEMTPMYIIGKVIDFALAKQFEKLYIAYFIDDYIYNNVYIKFY